MVEYTHRIGATRPIIEITFKDPDTDLPLALGSMTNPIGNVKMIGETANSITGRALTPTDPNNGRFDFEFEATDFTAPRQTGRATLSCEGDLPAGERFISDPIEIEIQEPYTL